MILRNRVWQGLLLCTLCLYGKLYAQEYPYIPEDKPFIRYGLNELEFPAGQDQYADFYKALDRLIFDGEGKINIIHIGGSHIQADILSDQMRQRLQTFVPGNRGGRGFLFPYRMAKTNNPWTYRPEYTGAWSYAKNVQRTPATPLGLSGMSVTTNDSLSYLRICFKGKHASCYDFNTVKVFHETGAENYEVHLADSSLEAERRVNSQLGYTEFKLAAHRDTLDLEFIKTGEGQRQFRLFGLSLENEDPGIVYNAIGVNGASVPSYLKCDLFSQHMKVIPPDLVILSIGINDAHMPAQKFSQARFERNYRTLIQQIKAAAPNAAILFTTNNDSYYRRRYPNRNAYKVRESMRKLAVEHQAAVWDMFGVMGGLGSVKTWEENGLAKADKIHFTAAGYRLVGDLLFSALLKAYDKHLTEGFNE